MKQSLKHFLSRSISTPAVLAAVEGRCGGGVLPHLFLVFEPPHLVMSGQRESGERKTKLNTYSSY